MPQVSRSSLCSSGLPIDVFWHACPKECLLSRHIDAITSTLMEVVKTPPNRRWNPYLEAMVRSEFRDRLVAASRGELVPVDHVKSIDHPLATEMFEIRWQHVQVTEAIESGKLRHRAVQVRLLHAEPGALGAAALGLHAHEKQVVTGDARATRAAQDAEIAVAVGVYGSAIGVWLNRSPDLALQRDIEET